MLKRVKFNHHFAIYSQFNCSYHVSIENRIPILNYTKLLKYTLVIHFVYSSSIAIANPLHSFSTHFKTPQHFQSTTKQNPIVKIPSKSIKNNDGNSSIISPPRFGLIISFSCKIIIESPSCQLHQSIHTITFNLSSVPVKENKIHNNTTSKLNLSKK